MKKFKALLSCALGAAMLCGCANVGKSTLLATPAQPSAFTYTDSDTDNFQTVSSGVNAFSARFAEAVYAEYEGDANFAVAPVSVYMALALASVCAAGDTRAQLLSALGTTEEELAANFAYLYSSLNRSYTGGQIAAANSIWMQEGPDFIDACLKALAGEYFCYPYAADFRGDNINANAALRHFISEATNVPEFEAEYDEDVKGVLSDTFGIEDFFVGGECNISSLLAGSVDDRGYPVYCSRVQHTTKLSVNKEGIEGAAVTIVANEGSSAELDEYEHIYYDFVIDRDFGYIVADSYGTILFTGAVNNI